MAVAQAEAYLKQLVFQVLGGTTKIRDKFIRYRWQLFTKKILRYAI
jgi:hypothetical protein